MPVVDLVPVVSEASRRVVRIELDWGGERVAELEMVAELDHLMILTVVVLRPVSLGPMARTGGFAQQVTEKILGAAVAEADQRGAVLSIAVPEGGTYRGYLAEQGFQPLAGEVWRRDAP